MTKYKPLYALYKGLKEHGTDLPDSYGSFERSMTQAGNAGASNRRNFYQSLKDSNYNVPDTYEKFYESMFVPVNNTTSRARKIGEPLMSEADKMRFTLGAGNIAASAQQTVQNVNRYSRLKQRKQKQQKDFGRVNLGTHLTPFGGDANDVVKDEFAYNPETGKAGAYVTSDNENAYTQSDAEQKQAILDKYGEEWNKAVDMGMVPSELDKADPDMSDTDVAMRQMERRQEWLDENQNRRSKELNESMHLQDSPFVASGGAVAPSSFNAAIGNEANRLSDAEYGAYNTAKAYNQMLRTTLLQELKEQKQRNENAGWWKDKWNDVSNYFGAMFNTMLDPKLYSQGVMDAAIASNLRQVKKGMEDGTIKKGSNAGEATQVMLSAIQQQQGEAAKQQQNGTKAYQYGDVSGRSLKFMGDFALSGWRDVMTTGFTKAGEKVGEKMALGALGKWFTKNTGRVLGDMAGSAALAATNQLGSTYNNVIERYVGMNNENGGVTQDKDGDLSFNKGVSLGKAIKDGLGSATIENFSEMFGEYLPGASKLLSKLGLSKVSSFFEKIGNNAYYKWLSNATNKSGIQGVMSEIAEEEFGTALHAAWGDGDGSWSDFNVFTNPDAREKQIDTCLGMFYSVGFMQSPRTAVGAINAVKYFNIKLQVTKADKFGQAMFGDNWEEIKSKIDVTTNADLTKTVLDATRSDSMNAKQKGAVINYAMFLSKLRGFNQASDAKTKDKVEEGETVPTLSNYLDDAYTEGHNADDADKHDIQIQHEDQSKTLAAALNISEQQLSGMSDEELESLTGQDDKLDQAIYDYQLSSARYQGVVDDAQDKVDLAAHQAEQRVNMYTDQSRGSVRNATIKASGGAEDYGVYIISGNIATHEDGSIDVSNSDDMILYFDPTTNRVEHADALMFAELGEELPADAVKAQAVADAKENAIKEVAGIIDGTVEVGSQFSVTDAHGTEHTYEVLADNGDGTAMITIDGNVPTELVKGENVQIPYSFEDLQKMKDLEDQKRLEAAKAEREQMEEERAEQQNQAQTTQAENPAQESNTQSAPIEDNLDYSDIIREDGRVQMVDVSDKDGNNLFPDAKDVFYIQGNKMRTKFAYIDANGELKTQSFPTGLVKIKTRGEVSVGDYKKYRNTILAAESSAMPASSMIEDNSGENRGEIEVETPTIEGEAAGPAEETTTSESGEDSATEQTHTAEQTPAITLEDGTVVPMLEDGNPDFSKLTAAQTAELYDSQFGEDADGIVSGYVSDAKKALDKANNMTVKGKTFVEQKAAKAAKEKAIADAQAAYDSAIAIRDAYNERQLAKEENTPEGRKSLIEKARRKYARLKNSEEWSERSGDLWNETVGKLLHRLYDATGIDVFNDTPNTVYEYVAANVGPYSLNYEGNDNSKGVQQETGLSRSDFAKLGWLAAEGKGMTIDAKVHRLWENRPSNLESADTQEIRNALISLITSGQTAFQARDYILNQRIELAESALEEQLRQEEDAAEAQRVKEEEEKKKAELEKKTEEESKKAEEGKVEEEKTEDNENTEFPDNSKEESKTVEVPEDATDEKPLGEQLDESNLPFSAKDNGQQQTTSERAADVEKNKVDDMKVVDNIVGQKTRKAFDRLAKMMGAEIQWQYSDKLGNGWIQENKDADGNVHRTIFITLDSSITEGAQFIFGHEMTHQIKNLNPAAYNELTQLVLDTYGSDAFDKAVDETTKRYSDAGFSGRNRDYYAEEVVADAVGEMIRDLNLAHTLAMKMSHPLLAAIHEILQKVKLAFYGTEYSDVTKNIIRSIEQAYVKTAKGQVTNSETGEDVSYSLRQKPEPKKKGVGYKVFVLKEGKLYPPMVANPDGAATPIGVWLDADAAPIAGESKTGRPQVKQGGKGTQGGSGKLAYRPGWHLGVVPYAIQFNRKDADGNKTLFPKNFVFAEVEYAADVDYQDEARQEGINPSGKYQHSLAGLKHLPTDGYYMYRTNPNPETDPWVITGAMKVNRILTRAEQAELVKNAGREPQQIQEGDIVTDDIVNSINQEIADAPKFSIKTYHGSQASFDKFDHSFMGSGEGAQAYGWGTYVSEVEGIAKAYAKQNAKKNAPSRLMYQDKPMTYKTPSIIYQVAFNMDKFNISAKEAISQMIDADEKKLASVGDTPFAKMKAKQVQDELNVLKGLNPSDFKINDDYDTVAQNLADTKSGLDLLEDELKDAKSYVDLYQSRLDEAKVELSKAKESGTGLGVDMYESDVAYYSEQVEKYKQNVKTKESDIKDVKTKIDALQKKLDSIGKPRNLYSVDIPDDTGDNYIGWDEPITPKMLEAKRRVMEEDGYTMYDSDGNYDYFEKTENGKYQYWQLWNRQKGNGLYNELSKVLHSDKLASLALSKQGIVGIKVIAGRNTGGNKEGKMNYVIFDENNAQITDHTKFSLRLKSAIEETETNPSDAQKESGNYKKGHIKFGGYDYTIENPKGSTRSGKDANGKEWKVTMHDTYGYIRGKFGKDGDHLDMFINDKADLDNWDGDVFVVDQVNPDGSFDEHKVMYGYDSMNDAEKAYLANYSKGWQGLGNITGASKAEFDKWLDTSNRKLKPFADYAKVKFSQAQSVSEPRYSLKDIKPIGVGAFGNIYNQFRGKSKAAIEFLKKLGSGEATAALHHHTIGDISLVWGDKKAGLDKILRKHPEVVDNLQSIIDSMEVVQESDNRVKLESPTHFAVVSKEYKGEPREQWLLTAYEKRESLENDKSMDTATSSLGGDTALSQSKGSAAKIDNSSETAKENGEKFSLKDEKTLAGVHNITEEKLLKAIKQGGLANPSVAVIDSSKQNHEDYGEISLILPSEKVAKRTGKNAGTWQGDAWTPTYPQVERQMSNKGAAKASKDVSSVPGDMYREVRRGLDRWLDGGEANSAMAYMFLSEKGVAPEPKKIQHKFGDDVYNELKSITAGDFNIYGIGKADAQKVLDMYIDAKFDGDKDLYEEKTKAWLERNKSIVDAGNKGGMRYTIAKDNVELYDEYGFNYKSVQTFVRDVEYDHRKTGVDMNATLNEVEDYIKTNNLTDEFNTWLEGKEKEYGIKEVIFDGFTPSGNRRYVPNTLENVSKIMKKQGRNGATGISVSFQNFAASLMPSYGTLKDIRSKKGLLTSDHEDLDNFNEKWSKVFFELGMKCQPDATGTFDDYGLARLSEAAKTSDPQAYLKKEYNVDFSEEDTKRLKEMVKAIKEESPAMYFETKFERPVGFNEFSSAVVPTTASDEVKQALQNAGVQIYEYDKEKEGDRSRAFNEAINSSDNIRFSLRGSTPYDKQMEEWMEKNHLEKGAVPMEKPIMGEGENIFDYANRMVEWTRNQNLWKTAPKQTGFQDALEKWKADNSLSPDAYPPVRPHRENYSSESDYAEDLEEYNKKKELWKSAPKPKDFDLSVDLEDMNKQLRNIRRAVLNQKNYDQRTVKAVSDLVRKMLNIGWGDGLSRGKVANLLSAAKNATGANDVKKYLDKAMGILAENYLNRLSTAYDNLINTKGARADQSGVIKMGSLDADGQAFMSEYKKAINMDDSSLNTYIANIEEDSAKNEDNVEMNDYRLAGIQAAIMFKQQIGGNDADIAELQRQIGELKNKKDATKEDKDLLKSLEKKLFENKFDRITMYENLLNNIQRMVKESKGRAKEFREEIAEHKNEILHRANLDLEGVDSTYYDTTTSKKKFVNNVFQRAAFSSTYTFEQFLKFFGKKAANGEGYLYNYFTKLNQDALDEEQLYNEMNRNALDEKTKELFGKKKFMKLVGIDGNGMKEMDIEVTDYSNKKTGKRTIHLKQGQMLYIYLVNKETDGEMKLRAMGITEEDVAAIEENLDPRVKAMGEWLQNEYLPECQRRYQATHTKYFGAPMKEVENYFPLAINNRARNVKEDVNQDSDAMSQLAGTSTGAIVTRRVNVIPLDIENADAFEVAFNHLQEMEEWSAMLPFRQDINTLLSYTHFRNQVQNMSSVAYGSGKTLWDEFKQTAQIAAGTYKPKVNAGMMDSRIAAAMGGVAVAKISGRLWTAIKQSQSATVFLPECDFTRFVKNGVNPYGSWKWAMENIPDFRKRVENMTYGDVKLRQYLDELEKYHDWTKVISKLGMAPNILVDGVTCAVGARSVYETEVNRLTKLGYPKEKAEEKAYYKAVAAYNKTQQSSGGMYLSPMQVDRTYVSAALSLFKNANFAYGRMQIEACRGLARTYDFWGGKHKTALIESMTRQIMEEDGLDENTARAIAKATYNRTFRQSIGRLINFATLVPISWALYKVLPYLLTGDDDDKKTDMIEEAVLKGFATSLSDNYVIPFASNILNAGLKVEDGKPTFDPEVFRYQNLYINPATSDLANIYSMIGNQKWYSVVNKFGMLGVQSLIGFNPETVGALYQAFAEADKDNGNTAKEWQIGILKAISAPEESIRELYMDELGLKSGNIKKIPLAELEKRYAERQINRDNLLSQIFMDAESFNGYVDKYQKSFEKKIKDKMDKWDEYDKKKADEFFDTTTDPKLKDMIAKKRVKDANAAADEQIAKEGLDQEKKGKEPYETAYDAVKMSIDVAEDNAISTYNKVLNKRYAALNDEYNNQTDAMKYIFMSSHPNFKAYKDIESEYTNYGKKMKELKEKLVSADGYDAKQTILKQIRTEREKFSELQSKVR